MSWLDDHSPMYDPVLDGVWIEPSRRYRPPKKWTSKGGVKIKIKKMSDSYIENVLNFLIRQDIKKKKTYVFIAVFMLEQKRREQVRKEMEHGQYGE